ncbi:DNA topoisomerase I [Candidatus Woesearchaeota archaeon]|nr:DNA topoisomerase I [Candidatus Woesearchaeota archaeon]
MVELIITEKPQASKKIAEALADGKPIKKMEKGVPYYEITRGKQDIIVGCAVGHLYTVGETEKNGWKYPVFDLMWIESGDKKGSEHTKKYLSVLKKIAKQAKTFTVACDYDIEGEVIGLNVVRYACKQKDAQRMKFSTLTKEDLVHAYEHKSKTLDWGQAQAGETRHFLDWMYGINISRALTSSIKKSGRFRIMSAGRVQGPALKILVDREKEIRAFKSEPFWQISLQGNVHKEVLEAWHEKDKFWKQGEANAVMKKVEGKKQGKTDAVNRNETKQAPPTPFDLTTLQTESYRALGIQPKETLEIAQELYTGGWISYPRTSSQILPSEIGYLKIMKALQKQEGYAPLVQKLIKGTLTPNNGKKTDPAHPAIYPTGVEPRGIKERKHKVYDLIVKRFFATFATHALRETQNVRIVVEQEGFVAKGTRTVEPGWHVFYAPYVRLEEVTLPKVAPGDSVAISSIDLHAKETSPPKRFTPASIIKELEKRGLGTKATRAQIVDTLFQRNYVTGGGSIEATEIGMKTEEMLEKHMPKIVDDQLTSHFEAEMDEIRENKKQPKEVLEEARQVLTTVLADFKHREKEIGEELATALMDTWAKESTVGKCQNCEKGTLVIKRGKFGRFVACDQYPECKTTFALPSNALTKVSDKACEHCKNPMILVIRKGKRPQELCINQACPSKKMELTKQQSSEMDTKTCPKCGEGKLTLRKSIYGQFIGCSRYPKCRYTQKNADTTPDAELPQE